MKVKIENLKDSQKLIKVEVDAESVAAVLDDVYGDIKKKASVPGYRIGNAPRDLLEVHYAETANEEALNRLIWERYREAVIQEGLDPIGYPVVETVDFDPSMAPRSGDKSAAQGQSRANSGLQTGVRRGIDKAKPLNFTVKVDVRPEFVLKNYKGIKIKSKPHEVADEDMDKALTNIQESMAQYKNIEPRPIASGDYVVCEYECYADGKLVDKNDKLWLYISDQIKPKELFYALLGAPIDAVKEVEVDHAKDYQHKDLAGKKGVYKVTPKQIKEKILPELNDDLAKETGHFNNLEELKKHIYQSISEAKKQQTQLDLENQIFDSLLKSHSFDVPNSTVERQTEQLANDAKIKLLYQGYKKEDLDKETDNLKKGFWENAKKHVQIYFIIEKIAKTEGIEIEEKELEAKIEEIAKNTKEDLSAVRKMLQDRGLMGNLKEQILHDKVVDFLLKEAKKVS